MEQLSGLEYSEMDDTGSFITPSGKHDIQKRCSVRMKSTAFVFLLCGFRLDLMAQTSHWKERALMTIYHEGKLLRAAKEAGFVEQWEHHPTWKKN